MKKDIHPAYVETQVTCTCGNTFTTRSTATSGVDPRRRLLAVPPVLHRQAEILDTGGRVARFEARFGKKATAPSSVASRSAGPRIRCGCRRRVVSDAVATPSRGA